ncbi:hypothetical protein MJ904_14500 [Massilia sp. MB5]|uniref:hypothetical protein n=1 Tax=unclassified Massilia TaxID=2609279 RepID=UPI00067D63B6|nr:MULTISPECIES: hypothetical protein [unclassified Massilia]AKU22011.1 hypothetical protein ACZ75_11585 [Massilia sp. NR 4-1]UMR28382.1 hypothetical protein MJ904_14500 [Massilia sp. MB5]
MLKGWGQQLRVGVGSHALSLLSVGRWGRKPPQVLAECSYMADEEHAALGTALRGLLQQAGVAGRALSFVLADELVRLWQVTPPANAARMADIEAAAALRFHSLYGQAPAAWQLSADWHASQPFYAAAMPRKLLAVLGQACADSGAAMVEVRPHFVALWNRWHGAIGRDAWFGVLHDKLLTLAVIEDGQLRALRPLPVPGGADHYWLGQMVRREALLFNLALPKAVQLCGVLPAALAKPGAGGKDEMSCIHLDAGVQGSSFSAASLLAWAGSAA